MRSLYYSSCRHILAVSTGRMILFESSGEELSGWEKI